MVSDPDMHRGTYVTFLPWCMPGSLTSGFLWSRWRGKCARHSRRMRNPQFYVSDKRFMAKNALPWRLVWVSPQYPYPWNFPSNVVRWAPWQPPRVRSPWRHRTVAGHVSGTSWPERTWRLAWVVPGCPGSQTLGHGHPESRQVESVYTVADDTIEGLSPTKNKSVVTFL